MSSRHFIRFGLFRDSVSAGDSGEIMKSRGSLVVACPEQARFLKFDTELVYNDCMRRMVN